MKEFWDRNITEEQLKEILNDETHPRFTEMGALLLLRNNEPKKVFKLYLNRILFAKNWSKIKKQMRKNQWGSQRIDFWQAIFEKLAEQLKDKGISLRSHDQEPRAKICFVVGKIIRDRRQQQNLTQKQLADKLGIKQQVVSQIEKGRGNPSLLTPNTIVAGTGGTLTFNVWENNKS